MLITHAILGFKELYNTVTFFNAMTMHVNMSNVLCALVAVGYSYT